MANEDVNLVHQSTPPSWYARTQFKEGDWVNVTVCEDCGLRGFRDDQHPVDPCRRCGGRVKQTVGKWVVLFEDQYIEQPWWKFWAPTKYVKQIGWWHIKEDERRC